MSNSYHIEWIFDNLTVEGLSELNDIVYGADQSVDFESQMAFGVDLNGNTLAFFQFGEPTEAIFKQMCLRFPFTDFVAIYSGSNEPPLGYYEFRSGVLKKYTASDTFFHHCERCQQIGEDWPPIIGYTDLRCIEIYQHQYLNKYACSCGEAWHDVGEEDQPDNCIECASVCKPISRLITEPEKSTIN